MKDELKILRLKGINFNSVNNKVERNITDIVDAISGDIGKERIQFD